MRSSESRCNPDLAFVGLLYPGREALGGGERAPELRRLDRGGRPASLRDGEGRAHRAVLRVAQLEKPLGGLRGTVRLAHRFGVRAAARGEDRRELRAQALDLAAVG